MDEASVAIVEIKSGSAEGRAPCRSPLLRPHRVVAEPGASIRGGHLLHPDRRARRRPGLRGAAGGRGSANPRRHPAVAGLAAGAGSRARTANVPVRACAPPCLSARRRSAPRPGMRRRAGVRAPMIRVADVTGPVRRPAAGHRRRRPRPTRRPLIAGIAPVVERLPAGDAARGRLPCCRRARHRPDALSVTPESHSSWKPVFARRSLGLAVVDACVSGRFRSPAGAAAVVADDAVVEWSGRVIAASTGSPGSPGWLRGPGLSCWPKLSPGPRRYGPRSTGAWCPPQPRWEVRDDVWACPAASRPSGSRAAANSAFRSRSDRQRSGLARLSRGPPALVSISSGHPQAGWEEELGLSLSGGFGLRSPSRPVPARIGGLWPETGVFRGGRHRRKPSSRPPHRGPSPR